MNAQEHCDDCCATAALYALGALPRNEAEQFEKRLSSECPLCSAAVANYGEIAELLALGVTPRQPPPEIRERLLERIRAGREAPEAPNPEMVLVRQDASPWVPSAVRGIETRQLLGDQTLLVRMQAGTVFPKHEHSMTEQCYVVEGSVTDSDGVTAYAGDYVCMAAGSTHAPIHSDSGCVLLLAYS